MTETDVIDVTRDAITVVLLASGPAMIVALVVGLVIALFQALTQIQEMTLTFVPKIVAIFATVLVLLPFMLHQLSGLMERLVDRIVAIG
jgi:flagellar biosynthetic protein FliQ